MAMVTLKDVSLPEIKTLQDLPRLQRLRERHFQSRPEICVELPRHLTQYLKNQDVKTDSPELRAGKLYRYVMENKKPRIAADNLLAGTTSTKAIGVMLYPDLYPLCMWPELETMATRKKNRFGITREEIDILNREVFPYWIDNTVMEITRRDYHNPRSIQVFERLIFYMVSKPETLSHTIPAYNLVVNQGLAAIIDDARGREAAATDRDQQDFYRAVGLALGGVLTYATKLSRKAQDLAAHEPDLRRRGELLKISEICRRVPARKPETFWEGLNAIWICKIALHQENANLALSLGRLDQILYPLYAEDIRQGRLTVPEAVELVGCFWLSIADHVPMNPESGEELFGGSGSNQAITLGGVDADGKDAVNDLTYVMLKATELLALRDPNVNARFHHYQNSRAYLERLCQVNLTTRATPCFHNDVSVIETLRSQGVTEGHARDYGVVGCVEPTSSGRTFGHTGAILFNLTAALEMALFGGKHRLTGDDQIGPETPPLVQMHDFKEFKAALEKQAGWLIDQTTSLNNSFGRTFQNIHRLPMLSALMEGCLESGRDALTGGATYNSSGAAIIGLADVVDSVTALQELIFARGKARATKAEMIAAINADWEGERFGRLHAWVKHSAEKYGRDSRLAKANANWLMGFLHRKFQAKKNYRGGCYTVGYWTMTNHAGYGRLTGALPNGRKKGESFASGITPVSGAAPRLPECLNFVAGLDHLRISNGQALNLKFFPATADLKRFADTVEAYFLAGGLQVQFNIIDRELLKDVVAHPDNYPDLLVRVSGYTAYFRDLNPQMQQEIITRAEYDLSDGLEHRYQD
jgi:pyruvate formate-lyase/glycerol dehydratase family glycyl radical enzyme